MMIYIIFSVFLICWLIEATPTYYPLCDDSKVFCVEIDNSNYPCQNCDGQTIQGIIDTIDTLGGYTIYLVGTNISTVTFSELVIIGTGKTTPSLESNNTIKPYPAHSFIWSSVGTGSNFILSGQWWVISGSGGYLKITNTAFTDMSSPMIEIHYGAILEKLVIETTKYVNFGISIKDCSGGNNKGYLMDEMIFKRGAGTMQMLDGSCYCSSSCTSSDFTNFYGNEKRNYIRNSIFEDVGLTLFYMGYIEGNYFTSSSSGAFRIYTYFNDGLYIVNNVFRLTSGFFGPSLIQVSYTKAGVQPEYDKYRFFNNHILDFDGSLSYLIEFSAWGSYQNDLPNIWYIYNNLIYATHCVAIQRSDGDGCAIHWKNNHLFQSGCETNWDDYCSLCTVSDCQDLGNNTCGSFNFEAVEAVPQYYKLLDDIPYGLSSPSKDVTFVLPSTDFDGNGRPGMDVLNRTTIGAFEYSCPSQCLSQGYIYCQKDECGCLGSLFGYSCQYTLNQANCPSCSPNSTCKGHFYNEFPYYCDCESGYYGSLCDEWNCYNISKDIISSCNTGDCLSPDECKCINSYFGKNCSDYQCFGIDSFDLNSVCNRRGECISPNECSCYENYFGLNCSIYSCFGIYNNESISSEQICSAHGDCLGYNNCTCNENYTTAQDCSLFSCNEIFYNDLANVCNKRGQCVEYNNCTCFENYYGDWCELFQCNGIEKSSKDVCSSHGTCLSYNNCSCISENYFGPFCEFHRCFEIMNNDTESVCSRHGFCADYNNCSCDQYYQYSLDCHIYQCFGIWFNETDLSICSGNGNCSSHNNCTCDPLFDAIPNSDCSNYLCNGSLNNDTNNVCNGKGNCTAPENCECDSNNYYGEYCQNFKCFGIFNNESSEVCSGNGQCIDINTCLCLRNYTHSLTGNKDCSSWNCFDVRYNNFSEVCSNHGNCSSPDYCSCEEKYQTTDNCGEWKCSNISNLNQTHVCSVHGICIDWNNCSCNTNYYGENCEIWSCFGVSNQNKTRNPCSGHGICIGHDTCICENTTRYFYPSEDVEGDCSLWKCNGILRNETSNVCGGGFGICKDHDTCICKEGYGGKFCSHWNCSEIDKDLTIHVCSGHGSCISPDNCSCTDSNYNGEWCNRWSCFGTSLVDIDSVCSGHGSCIDVNHCLCFNGFFSLESHCDFWWCGNYIKNDSDVCSGEQNGKCIDAHECSCIGGFEGEFCASWSCTRYEHTNLLTCNGNGRCVSPSNCNCDPGFGGEQCDTNILLIATLVPLLSFVGTISGFGILILIFVFFVCCSCFICCFVVGSFLIVSFLCIQLAKYRKSNQKFGMLKNFDVLLQEQILEEDTSIAHIKINEELFQIDHSEIEISRIIGEGGSNSVVYQGLWRKTDIAFKCFKTRSICSTQERFEEFENEVEILASVNHPNILRFLGCSLKPPRVGIVLEYCENGDLTTFMAKYKSVYFKSIEVNEKLRICLEVVLGMDYLHSRNIIHRDLKCENVLLDKGHTCKIMDFGLSRFVAHMSMTKTKSIGTSLYMAPEIILSSHYNGKVDVFSFAIMMYIILSENFSPYGENYAGIEIRVANDPNYRPDISQLSSNNGLNIPKETIKWIEPAIIKCWNYDPSKRPSFSSIAELFRKYYLEKSNTEDMLIEKVFFKDGDDDDDQNRNNSKSISRMSIRSVEEYNNKMVVMPGKELLKMKTELMLLRKENKKLKIESDSRLIEDEF